MRTVGYIPEEKENPTTDIPEEKENPTTDVPEEKKKTKKQLV